MKCVRMILVALLVAAMAACGDDGADSDAGADPDLGADPDFGSAADTGVGDTHDAQPLDVAADLSVELDGAEDSETPLDGSSDVADATVDDVGSDTASAEACAAPPGDLPVLSPSRVGRFERYAAFPSGDLRDRGLTVLLPEGYGSSGERYPVLYMHDGQNLFDAGDAAFGVEWQVDEVLDGLVGAGALRPYLVVGIDNTPDRMDEYTPDWDPGREGGGRGAEYVALLVDRIKPFIDAHYRTLCGPANTAVIGSSLGGLISLQIGLDYPEVFGRVGAVSPSLWWNARSAVARVAAADRLPARLWLDGGSAEGESGPGGASSVTEDVWAVAQLGPGRGAVYGSSIACLEDIGAAHNEASWAARLPAVFMWTLGDGAWTTATPADAASLTAYRSLIAPGERSDLVVEARYAHGARITWPVVSAGITSSEPAVLGLSADGSAMAYGVGRSTLAGSIGGLAIQTEIEVSDSAHPVLRFEVAVPGGEAAVHLTGSSPALGNWDGVGVAMSHEGELWVAEIVADLGASIEYKYTRGSWDTVEKDANGSEVGNRVVSVDGSQTLSDTVVRWADQ